MQCSALEVEPVTIFKYQMWDNSLEKCAKNHPKSDATIIWGLYEKVERYTSLSISNILDTIQNIASNFKARSFFTK